ncbi:hypothetical protein 162285338 [Organic Lake phycodnavirus 1]|nr:hypothetical protein 162285338 [Organic Lake phycodnavirus 1]
MHYIILYYFIFFLTQSVKILNNIKDNIYPMMEKIKTTDSIAVFFQSILHTSNPNNEVFDTDKTYLFFE